MAIEIAKAYMQVIPSMRGVSGHINKALNGVDTTKSGNFLGKQLSSGIGVGVFKENGIIGKAVGLAGKAVKGAALATGAVVGGTLAMGIGGGIKRADTINNFPNVMKNFGISSDAAAKTIESLSDSLKGLPTPLDAAVSGVQRLVSKNGDLGQSEKMFLAVNNAILAGGAPMDQQANALEQLTQAYSKGNMDMVEWRSLQMAMPAQLNQVAKAMGLSTDALGEGLRTGEISMDSFMDTLMQLNEEGIDGLGSFEEQARRSTGGIQTMMANARAAVERGWQGVINAFGSENISAILGGITQAVDTGFGAIAPIFETAGNSFSSFVTEMSDKSSFLRKSFDDIAEGVLALADTIIPFVESIADVLQSAASEIYDFAMQFDFFQEHFGTAESAVQTVKGALESLADTISKVTDFLTENKEAVGKVVAAVVGLSAFGTVFNAIKVAVVSAGGAVGGVLAGLGSGLGRAGSFLGKFSTTAGSACVKLGTTFTTLSKGGSGALGIIKGALSSLGGVAKSVLPKLGGAIKIVASAFMKLTPVGKVISIIVAILSLLAGAIKKAYDESESFRNVVDGVAQFLSGAFNTAVEGAKAIFEGLSDVLSDVGSVLQDVLVIALDKISQGLEKIEPVIEMVKDAFEQFKSQVSDAFSQIDTSKLSEAFENLKDVLENLKDTAGEAFENLKETLSEIDLSALIEAFENLKKTLSEDLQPALEDIGGALSDLWEDLQPIVEQIGGVLMQVLPVLATIIGGVLVTALGILTGLLTGLAGLIGGIVTALRGIVEIITGVLTIAFGILTLDLDTISQGFEQLGQGIITLFSGLWDAVSGFVMGFVEGVTGFFTSLLGDSKMTFEELKQTITDKITKAKDSAIRKAQELVDGVINFFTSLPSRAREKFEQMKSFVLTSLGALVNSAKARAKSIVDGITQAFNEAPGKARRAFENVKSNIINALSGAVNSAKGIGRDIVNGIISGVSGAAGRLTRKMRDIASDAINAAKRKLGIASPSKVFMEIGQFTVEGFAKGIEDNKDLVAKTMQGMENSISPKIATSIAANADLLNPNALSYGHKNQTVNVYIDGMRFSDDPEIERLVLQIYERIKRSEKVMKRMA